MERLIFKIRGIAFILFLIGNFCGIFSLPSHSDISNSPLKNTPPLKPVEYFDLGYTFIEGETIFYPGQRFDYQLYEDVKGVNVTEENKRYWLASFSFCMGEHGGTHVDAPYHLNEFGWKLEEIPIQRLMNIPANIVDVEEHVFASPNPQDFVVDLEYFLEHERKFGPIQLGSVILVHTGWSRFWPNKEQYLGTKSDGTLNFPGISERAAKWLVSERKIVGIGIDTNSIDVGNTKGYSAAHIVLCGNNVYIIENVANLNELLRRVRPVVSPTPTETSFPVLSNGERRPFTTVTCPDLRINVLPIKSKGTGGPARVIAQCNY